MGSINVAIVGVGNCASALVQGIERYGGLDAEDEPVPGVLHPELGGYRIGDLDLVCAFDVDERKVGCDLGEAIFASPNTMEQILDEAPHLDAPVYLGPGEDEPAATLDEVDDAKRYRPAGGEPVDPVAKLSEHEVDVLVNLLPAGAERTTHTWMQAAIDAGVAVVNCLPVPIATDPSWAKRFEDAGLPVLGDDVKAQAGPTSVHQALADELRKRGVQITETYQLNVAGNTDYLSLQDEKGAKHHRGSARQAVRSRLDGSAGEQDVVVGPSDHVPFLGDERVTFVRVQGRGFLEEPVELELRLSVQASPNAAAIVLDAIRCAQLAADRGHSGPVDQAAGFLFKHPPTRRDHATASDALQAFIDASPGGES